MTIWLPELDPEGPSYLAISRALEADIRSGRLPDGSRLPTHRALARALGVNVGTVSRAYAEARRRGLVSGEVGRGSFVRQPSGPLLTPRPGATPARIDLGANVPLRRPAPDLRAALRALAERDDLETLAGYGDPGGSARVRTAGAAWLARLGIATTPDRVAVCAGSQHAILAALSTLAGPGETVLAESLTYPGFLAAARLLGLRVRPVRMDREGIVPEALEAACAERPRLLYCMPDLQNPTTAVLPPARRRAVAEIARAHDLAIVVDDVLGPLVEAGPPLASLAPELVVTIAGVSKLLLPGLRTAFVAAPARHVARLGEMIWASTWMASTLGAEIVAGWIEDGTADAIVAARRREIDLRTDLARRLLRGLRCHTRPGAPHLWLELPPGQEPARVAATLLDQGVVVVAAEDFAVPPAAAPRAIRISLSAAQDLPALRQGLEIVSATLGAAPGIPAPKAVRL